MNDKKIGPKSVWGKLVEGLTADEKLVTAWSWEEDRCPFHEFQSESHKQSFFNEPGKRLEKGEAAVPLDFYGRGLQLLGNRHRVVSVSTCTTTGWLYVVCESRVTISKAERAASNGRFEGTAACESMSGKITMDHQYSECEFHSVLYRSKDGGIKWESLRSRFQKVSEKPIGKDIA